MSLVSGKKMKMLTFLLTRSSMFATLKQLAADTVNNQMRLRRKNRRPDQRTTAIHHQREKDARSPKDKKRTAGVIKETHRPYVAYFLKSFNRLDSAFASWRNALPVHRGYNRFFY